MKKNISSKYSSRELIDIPQYQFENFDFIVGDVVRSYRTPFDSDKCYKNNFIQGVVIGFENWVCYHNQLIVKWHLDFHFGTIGRVKLPHNGSDTFSISRGSPFLVKVNKSQLSLAI